MHKHTQHNNRHHDLYADIEKIKRAFSDTASDVRDNTVDALSESMQSIKHQSAKVQDGVADYVTHKPFKSIGIAFLIGAVMGYLYKK